MSMARLSRCRGWLFLACVSGVFSLCAFGQTPAPNAKELANRVDHHYNSLRSLKSVFTQTYQGLGMDRTESGTLLLLKPGRMRWNYNAPKGKVFILNGKYAWSYTPGDAQAQRIPAKELNDLRSPLRYLLGHAQLNRELEHLTAIPAADGEVTLTGVPKGMENRVAQLTLTVTADGTITAISIKEIDGSVTSFAFTDQVPNAAISPATFQFTPPPGVPVVDALPPV